MRILFISRSLITNFRVEKYGVYQRMKQFIDALKENNHFDLLFYVAPSIDLSPYLTSRYRSQISDYFQADINPIICPREAQVGERYYADGVFNFCNQRPYKSLTGKKQVQALEECLHQKPKLIFAHRLGAMIPLLKTKVSLPPVYFDLDDIEHMRDLRQLSVPLFWWGKALLYLKLPALLKGELSAIHLSCKTFVCSQKDSQYLNRYLMRKKVFAIPNTIKMPEAQPLTKLPTILFIGSYNYEPNLLAAEYLIKKVWPLIHKTIPNAKLIIAGHPPEKINGYFQHTKGVEFTGFFDDLDKLYRKTRIVCCPVFFGGGMQTKLIEAALYGKAIAASSFSVLPTVFCNEKELLICNKPEEFADACIKLLTDYELCAELANAARKKAQFYYNRNRIIENIKTEFGIEK
jgi:glycosyltransferase involved in cell wall biosynthesis